MNKWLSRMEKVMANTIRRAFKKQQGQIHDFLRENNAPDELSLRVFIEKTGKPVIGAMMGKVKTTLNRGFEDGKKITMADGRKVDIGKVDFSIPTKPESIYIEALENLHLSQRYGSITNTTTERVQKIVVDGVKKGMTYKEIADNIEKLDGNVFSRNRAELIAVNQVGKAYQFGEFRAMEEFWDNGYLVMKYWSTVNDNRVTRSHTRNQNEGWRNLKESFLGTGDMIPPAKNNPRCRCALRYKVGDKRGAEQSLEMRSIIKSSEKSKESLEFHENLREIYNPETDYITNTLLENFDENTAFQKMRYIKPQLTKEEVIAFYLYTSGNSFKEINSILRDRKTRSEYIGPLIALENGLEEYPFKKGTVWRGIDGNSKIVKTIMGLQIGGLFSERGFMSTSTEKDNSEKFAENNGIILQIQSKTGKDISEISNNKESEVLFPPGRNLIFVGKKDNIYMFEEI